MTSLLINSIIKIIPVVLPVLILDYILTLLRIKYIHPNNFNFLYLIATLAITIFITYSVFWATYKVKKRIL